MLATGTLEAHEAPSASWYDAGWLAKYIEAKQIVARVAPERLDEFVASFEVLRVPPAFRQRVLRGFLSADQLARLRATIGAIPKERFETGELSSFGRFIARGGPEFGALQAALAGQVSELAGEPVEPSYNFLSLYTRLGVCRPHLDAPSAKWTLDICIDQSSPWPIHFSRAVPWPETADELRAIVPERIPGDPGLGFEEEVLMPGDAVLFSGTNQWHYRDALQASGRAFCDLLFLHYVPCGAADLTQPKAWARLLDIPELAAMADLEQVY